MKLSRVTATTALLSGFIFTTSCGSKSTPASDNKTPDHSRIENSIALANGALLKMLKPNGQFIYELNFANKKESVEYNILRHSGAVYALASYATEHGSKDAIDAIKRANAFTLSQSLFLAESFSAITSDPALEKRGKQQRALLGGTALALAAVLTTEKLSAESTSEQTIRSMAEFLLYMQKPDGGFYTRLVYATGTRSDDEPSLYYPGEAILALTLMYEWDKSDERDRWLQAAHRALSSLVKNQKPNSPDPDNWALVALREMRRLKIAWGAEENSALRAFALNIISLETAQQIREPGHPTTDGALRPNGAVNGTAARLEGVISGLIFLKDGKIQNRAALEHAAASAARFLLRAQTREPGYEGGFTNSIASKKSRWKDESSSTIRIDNIQHAMMALRDFEELGAPLSVEQPVYLAEHFQFSPKGLLNIKMRSEKFDELYAPFATVVVSDFSRGYFSEANFQGAHFRETQFQEAAFESSDLDGLRVNSCDMREVRFSDSDLRGASFMFSDLRGARFDRSNLDQAIFLGTDLTGASYDQDTELPFSNEEARERGMVFRPSTAF